MVFPYEPPKGKIQIKKEKVEETKKESSPEYKKVYEQIEKQKEEVKEAKKKAEEEKRQIREYREKARLTKEEMKKERIKKRPREQVYFAKRLKEIEKGEREAVLGKKAIGEAETDISKAEETIEEQREQIKKFEEEGYKVKITPEGIFKFYKKPKTGKRITKVDYSKILKKRKQLEEKRKFYRTQIRRLKTLRQRLPKGMSTERIDKIIDNLEKKKRSVERSLGKYLTPKQAKELLKETERLTKFLSMIETKSILKSLKGKVSEKIETRIKTIKPSVETYMIATGYSPEAFEQFGSFKIPDYEEGEIFHKGGTFTTDKHTYEDVKDFFKERSRIVATQIVTQSEPKEVKLKEQLSGTKLGFLLNIPNIKESEKNFVDVFVSNLPETILFRKPTEKEIQDAYQRTYRQTEYIPFSFRENITLKNKKMYEDIGLTEPELEEILYRFQIGFLNKEGVKTAISKEIGDDFNVSFDKEGLNIEYKPEVLEKMQKEEIEKQQKTLVTKVESTLKTLGKLQEEGRVFPYTKESAEVIWSLGSHVLSPMTGTLEYTASILPKVYVTKTGNFSIAPRPIISRQEAKALKYKLQTKAYMPTVYDVPLAKVGLAPEWAGKYVEERPIYATTGVLFEIGSLIALQKALKKPPDAKPKPSLMQKFGLGFEKAKPIFGKSTIFQQFGKLSAKFEKFKWTGRIAKEIKYGQKVLMKPSERILGKLQKVFPKTYKFIHGQGFTIGERISFKLPKFSYRLAQLKRMASAPIKAGEVTYKGYGIAKDWNILERPWEKIEIMGKDATTLSLVGIDYAPMSFYGLPEMPITEEISKRGLKKLAEHQVKYWSSEKGMSIDDIIRLSKREFQGWKTPIKPKYIRKVGKIQYTNLISKDIIERQTTEFVLPTISKRTKDIVRVGKTEYQPMSFYGLPEMPITEEISKSIGKTTRDVLRRAKIELKYGKLTRPRFTGVEAITKKEFGIAGKIQVTKKLYGTDFLKNIETYKRFNIRYVKPKKSPYIPLDPFKKDVSKLTLEDVLGRRVSTKAFEKEIAFIGKTKKVSKEAGEILKKSPIYKGQDKLTFLKEPFEVLQVRQLKTGIKPFEKASKGFRMPEGYAVATGGVSLEFLEFLEEGVTTISPHWKKAVPTAIFTGAIKQRRPFIESPEIISDIETDVIKIEKTTPKFKFETIDISDIKPDISEKAGEKYRYEIGVKPAIKLDIGQEMKQKQRLKLKLELKTLLMQKLKFKEPEIETPKPPEETPPKKPKEKIPVKPELSITEEILPREDLKIKKKLITYENVRLYKPKVLASPFLVMESQIKYGKATHPKTTASLIQKGIITGFKIPTIELIEERKGKRKPKKSKYDWRLGENVKSTI